MRRLALLFTFVGAAFLLTACSDNGSDNSNGQDDVVEPPGIPVPLDPAPPALPPTEVPSGDAVGECTGAGRIEWADAPDHVGTKIALFGPVDEVEQDQFFGEGGSALVVGYPEGDAELVDVFIPERVRDRFSGDLSTRYQGKVVCAVGVLQQADDQLVLVINQPQDIVLV